MKRSIEHYSDGDYVVYWTPHYGPPPVPADSPSASEWMIPGTQLED